MYGLARPQLTVITVTYNDIPGVRGTLTSLAPLLDNEQVEVVVVDGGTEGSSIETLSHDFPQVRVVSEPDRGIYDAMNKGIALASGRFLWFLNGGDTCEFLDARVLSVIAQSQTDEVLMFDYLLDMGGGRLVRRRARHPIYLWHALPTSHQAIFYGQTAIASVRYDLSYKVSADYAFTLEVAKNARKISRHHIVAAKFAVGGTSTLNAHQIAADAKRAQLRAGFPRLWSALSFPLHRVSAYLRSPRRVDHLPR